MCNIVLTEELAKQVEFVVFNIAFSKESKEFTTQQILDDLKGLELNVPQRRVENIIDSWLDNDLVFENMGSYVIYS